MEIGDIVIVTARENGHEFKIGQEVEIIELCEDDVFKCQSLSSVWWLTEQELSAGRQETVPNEYWSGGIAKNH